MAAYIKRTYKVRWLLVGYDLVIFAFVAFVFLWRYRGGGVLDAHEATVHTIAALICIFLPRFIGGTYKQIWRYGGVESYLRLILVDTVGMVLYFVADHLPFVPISVLATSRIISIVGLDMLGGLIMRMCYRYIFKYAKGNRKADRAMLWLMNFFGGSHIVRQRDDMRHKKKVAIVGAGRVGVSLAENLMNNEESDLVPVCFIDTMDYKIGRTIHGLPVLDQNKLTVAILNDLDLDEIIIAIPSLDSDRKKALYEELVPLGYDIKVFEQPVLMKPNGKLLLRSFDIQDVLFRKQIVIDDDATSDYYRNKTILVTGGGGSIGSELSRQVAAMCPKQLILLDVYENCVYDVQQELRMKYRAHLNLQVEICSITDKKALDAVFKIGRAHV